MVQCSKIQKNRTGKIGTQLQKSVKTPLDEEQWRKLINYQWSTVSKELRSRFQQCFKLYSFLFQSSGYLFLIRKRMSGILQASRSFPWKFPFFSICGYTWGTTLEGFTGPSQGPISNWYLSSCYIELFLSSAKISFYQQYQI